jgi:hypothetical protein
VARLYAVTSAMDWVAAQFEVPALDDEVEVDRCHCVGFRVRRVRLPPSAEELFGPKSVCLRKESWVMSLRPLILRFMLCLAFVLASSYVQAMAHVDNPSFASTVHVAKAKLPPCHQTTNRDKSDSKGAHHDGCCSNFACAIGLATEYVPTPVLKATSIHDIDYGTTSRSAVRRPLNPPPKSI